LDEVQHRGVDLVGGEQGRGHLAGHGAEFDEGVRLLLDDGVVSPEYSCWVTHSRS
jgi:hypothetical protein